MEIKNARINGVTIGLDDRERLSACVTFESYNNSFYNCEFLTPVVVDNKRLVKLMKLTSVLDIEDLNRKVVRIVVEEKTFYGFGDPVLDLYIPCFGKSIDTVTEKEFKELLKTV